MAKTRVNANVTVNDYFHILLRAKYNTVSSIGQIPNTQPAGARAAVTTEATELEDFNLLRRDFPFKEVHGEFVYLRGSADVPFDKDKPMDDPSRITDWTRIDAMLDSMALLAPAGAKIVVQPGWLKRPKGVDPKLTTYPVFLALRKRALERKIIQNGDDMKFGPSSFPDGIKSIWQNRPIVEGLMKEMTPGQFLVLENPRFDDEYQKPTDDQAETYAAWIAEKFKYIVQDSFAQIHRSKVPDMTRLSEKVRTYVGIYLEKEIKFSQAFREFVREPNRHRLVLVLGGIKIEVGPTIKSKLQVTLEILPLMHGGVGNDTIEVGGGMAYTFMIAKHFLKMHRGEVLDVIGEWKAWVANHPGYDKQMKEEAIDTIAGQIVTAHIPDLTVEYARRELVAGSYLDKQFYQTVLLAAEVILEAEKNNVTLYLSVDHTMRNMKTGEIHRDVKDMKSCSTDWWAIDIGTETRKLFGEPISDAGAVVQAGTMGMADRMDIPEGREGNDYLLDQMSASSALTMTAGGESTFAAVEHDVKITHRSIGGGSMFESMIDELKGVTALRKSSAVRGARLVRSGDNDLDQGYPSALSIETGASNEARAAKSDLLQQTGKLFDSDSRAFQNGPQGPGFERFRAVYRHNGPASQVYGMDQNGVASFLSPDQKPGFFQGPDGLAAVGLRQGENGQKATSTSSSRTSDSGIGWLSSLRVSINSWIASLARDMHSSTDPPSVQQPGSAGTDTENPSASFSKIILNVLFMSLSPLPKHSLHYIFRQGPSFSWIATASNGARLTQPNRIRIKLIRKEKWKPNWVRLTRADIEKIAGQIEQGLGARAANGWLPKVILVGAFIILQAVADIFRPSIPLNLRGQFLSFLVPFNSVLIGDLLYFKKDYTPYISIGILFSALEILWPRYGPQINNFIAPYFPAVKVGLTYSSLDLIAIWIGVVAAQIIVTKLNKSDTGSGARAAGGEAKTRLGHVVKYQIFMKTMVDLENIIFFYASGWIDEKAREEGLNKTLFLPGGSLKETARTLVAMQITRQIVERSMNVDDRKVLEKFITEVKREVDKEIDLRSPRWNQYIASLLDEIDRLPSRLRERTLDFSDVRDKYLRKAVLLRFLRERPAWINTLRRACASAYEMAKKLSPLQVELLDEQIIKAAETMSPEEVRIGAIPLVSLGIGDSGVRSVEIEKILKKKNQKLTGEDVVALVDAADRPIELENNRPIAALYTLEINGKPVARITRVVSPRFDEHMWYEIRLEHDAAVRSQESPFIIDKNSPYTDLLFKKLWSGKGVHRKGDPEEPEESSGARMASPDAVEKKISRWLVAQGRPDLIPIGLQAHQALKKHGIDNFVFSANLLDEMLHSPEPQSLFIRRIGHHVAGIKNANRIIQTTQLMSEVFLPPNIEANIQVLALLIHFNLKWLAQRFSSQEIQGRPVPDFTVPAVIEFSKTVKRALGILKTVYDNASDVELVELLSVILNKEEVHRKLEGSFSSRDFLEFVIGYSQKWLDIERQILGARMATAVNLRSSKIRKAMREILDRVVLLKETPISIRELFKRLREHPDLEVRTVTMNYIWNALKRVPWLRGHKGLKVTKRYGLLPEKRQEILDMIPVILRERGADTTRPQLRHELHSRGYPEVTKDMLRGFTEKLAQRMALSYLSISPHKVHPAAEIRLVKRRIRTMLNKRSEPEGVAGLRRALVDRYPKYNWVTRDVIRQYIENTPELYNHSMFRHNPPARYGIIEWDKAGKAYVLTPKAVNLLIRKSASRPDGPFRVIFGINKDLYHIRFEWPDDYVHFRVSGFAAVEPHALAGNAPRLGKLLLVDGNVEAPETVEDNLSKDARTLFREAQEFTKNAGYAFRKGSYADSLALLAQADRRLLKLVRFFSRHPAHRDYQAALNALWNHHIPAVRKELPGPENGASAARLAGEEVRPASAKKPGGLLLDAKIASRGARAAEKVKEPAQPRTSTPETGRGARMAVETQLAMRDEMAAYLSTVDPKYTMDRLKLAIWNVFKEFEKASFDLDPVFIVILLDREMRKLAAMPIGMNIEYTLPNKVAIYLQKAWRIIQAWDKFSSSERNLKMLSASPRAWFFWFYQHSEAQQDGFSGFLRRQVNTDETQTSYAVALSEYLEKVSEKLYISNKYLLLDLFHEEFKSQEIHESLEADPSPKNFMRHLGEIYRRWSSLQHRFSMFDTEASGARAAESRIIKTTHDIYGSALHIFNLMLRQHVRMPSGSFKDSILHDFRRVLQMEAGAPILAKYLYTPAPGFTRLIHDKLVQEQSDLVARRLPFMFKDGVTYRRTRAVSGGHPTSMTTIFRAYVKKHGGKQWLHEILFSDVTPETAAYFRRVYSERIGADIDDAFFEAILRHVVLHETGEIIRAHLPSEFRTRFHNLVNNDRFIVRKIYAKSLQRREEESNPLNSYDPWTDIFSDYWALFIDPNSWLRRFEPLTPEVNDFFEEVIAYFNRQHERYGNMLFVPHTNDGARMAKEQVQEFRRGIERILDFDPTQEGVRQVIQQTLELYRSAGFPRSGVFSFFIDKLPGAIAMDHQIAMQGLLFNKTQQSTSNVDVEINYNELISILHQTRQLGPLASDYFMSVIAPIFIREAFGYWLALAWQDEDEAHAIKLVRTIYDRFGRVGILIHKNSLFAELAFMRDQLRPINDDLRKTITELLVMMVANEFYEAQHYAKAVQWAEEKGLFAKSRLEERLRERGIQRLLDLKDNLWKVLSISQNESSLLQSELRKHTASAISAYFAGHRWITGDAYLFYFLMQLALWKDTRGQEGVDSTSVFESLSRAQLLSENTFEGSASKLLPQIHHMITVWENRLRGARAAGAERTGNEEVPVQSGRSTLIRWNEKESRQFSSEIADALHLSTSFGIEMEDINALKAGETAYGWQSWANAEGQLSLVRVGHLLFLDESLRSLLDGALLRKLGANLVFIKELSKSHLSASANKPFTNTISTIFLMLRDDFSGIQAWDMGAAEGILGLVSWKLGADSIVFIEDDKDSFEYIRPNLSLNEVKEGESYHVLRGDLPTWLRDERYFHRHQMAPRGFARQVQLLPKKDLPIAVISNIGSWSEYTASNITTIDLIPYIEKRMDTQVTRFYGGGYQEPMLPDHLHRALVDRILEVWGGRRSKDDREDAEVMAMHQLATSKESELISLLRDEDKRILAGYSPQFTLGGISRLPYSEKVETNGAFVSWMAIRSSAVKGARMAVDGKEDDRLWIVDGGKRITHYPPSNIHDLHFAHGTRAAKSGDDFQVSSFGHFFLAKVVSNKLSVAARVLVWVALTALPGLFSVFTVYALPLQGFIVPASQTTYQTRIERGPPILFHLSDNNIPSIKGGDFSAFGKNIPPSDKPDELKIVFSFDLYGSTLVTPGAVHVDIYEIQPPNKGTSGQGARLSIGDLKKALGEPLLFKLAIKIFDGAALTESDVKRLPIMEEKLEAKGVQALREVLTKNISGREQLMSALKKVEEAEIKRLRKLIEGRSIEELELLVKILKKPSESSDPFPLGDQEIGTFIKIQSDFGLNHLSFDETVDRLCLAFSTGRRAIIGLLTRRKRSTGARAAERRIKQTRARMVKLTDDAQWLHDRMEQAVITVPWLRGLFHVRPEQMHDPTAQFIVMVGKGVNGGSTPPVWMQAYRTRILKRKFEERGLGKIIVVPIDTDKEDDLWRILKAGKEHPQVRWMGFTVPFKSVVGKSGWIDEWHPAAWPMNTTNTVPLIRTPDGGVRAIGMNTDGPSFVEAHRSIWHSKKRGADGRSFKDKTIVVLGYGGVGQAIVASILKEEELPKQLIVGEILRREKPESFKDAQQEFERVMELLEQKLGNRPNARLVIANDPEDKTKNSDEILSALRTADIIINATPIGMHAEPGEDSPNSPVKDNTVFHSGQILYDVIYRTRTGEALASPFLRQGRTQGIREVYNGTAMFILNIAGQVVFDLESVSATPFSQQERERLVHEVYRSIYRWSRKHRGMREADELIAGARTAEKEPKFPRTSSLRGQKQLGDFTDTEGRVRTSSGSEQQMLNVGLTVDKIVKMVTRAKRDVRQKEGTPERPYIPSIKSAIQSLSNAKALFDSFRQRHEMGQTDKNRLKNAIEAFNLEVSKLKLERYQESVYQEIKTRLDQVVQNNEVWAGQLGARAAKSQKNELKFRIPIAKPYINVARWRRIREVLTTKHPRYFLTQRFEREMNKLLGLDNQERVFVATKRGRDALALIYALLALENKNKPMRIAMPSFTYHATWTAHELAEKILGDKGLFEADFVDIDPSSFLMDLNALEEKLVHHRVDAIIAVDIFSNVNDYRRLEDLSRRYGVPLFLDAAHNLAGRRDGVASSTVGRGVIYSFSFSKALNGAPNTLIGGGLVINKADYLKLKATGFLSGLRMTEGQAAALLANLPDLSSYLARRRQIASQYRRGLADLPGVSFQKVVGRVTNRHITNFTILINPVLFGMNRDEFRQFLALKSIETIPYFSPLHRAVNNDGLDLPQTEYLASRALSLPFSHAMTDSEVEEVIEAVREASQQIGRGVKRPGEEFAGTRLGNARNIPIAEEKEALRSAAVHFGIDVNEFERLYTEKNHHVAALSHILNEIKYRMKNSRNWSGKQNKQRLALKKLSRQLLGWSDIDFESMYRRNEKPYKIFWRIGGNSHVIGVRHVLTAIQHSLASRAVAKLGARAAEKTVISSEARNLINEPGMRFLGASRLEMTTTGARFSILPHQFLVEQVSTSLFRVPSLVEGGENPSNHVVRSLPVRQAGLGAKAPRDDARGGIDVVNRPSPDSLSAARGFIERVANAQPAQVVGARIALSQPVRGESGVVHNYIYTLRQRGNVLVASAGNISLIIRNGVKRNQNAPKDTKLSISDLQLIENMLDREIHEILSPIADSGALKIFNLDLDYFDPDAFDAQFRAYLDEFQDARTTYLKNAVLQISSSSRNQDLIDRALRFEGAKALFADGLLFDKLPEDLETSIQNGTALKVNILSLRQDKPIDLNSYRDGRPLPLRGLASRDLPAVRTVFEMAHALARADLNSPEDLGRLAKAWKLLSGSNIDSQTILEIVQNRAAWTTLLLHALKPLAPVDWNLAARYLKYRLQVDRAA